jgi:hypothetical protein
MRPPPGRPMNGGRRCRSFPMLDAILVIVGLGFFAVTAFYAVACDRL